MKICVYGLLIVSFICHCFADDFNIIDTIVKNGYPVEYHEIVTEDGYILGTYRIPHGRRSRTNNTNKYPVLLMHGLLSNAEGYVLLGPDKALSYVLADNGYDVWLCNARGTQHSRKHKFLNPDTDVKFWRFSWHEIGTYDIPAMIDFVLNITNQKRLHFVGHSQGSTAFFVMGSERPEYNQKIKVAVLLSPPVFFNQANSAIPVQFMPLIQMVAESLRIYELVPLVPFEILRQLSQIFCGPNSKIITSCREILALLSSSYNEEQLELSTIPLITATQPGGSSTQQLFHYFQLTRTGRFQKYDWGPKENQRKYGSDSPPDYNLKNVTAPVAIFYSENDAFTRTGVSRLPRVLPNVVEFYKVPYKNWTHIDFIWGRDVNIYLNKRVLEVMKKYDNT